MKLFTRVPLAAAALCAVGGASACESLINVPGFGDDVIIDPEAPIQPETPRGPSDPAACDPGVKVLHRLNRTEYNNTVQALLGTTARPADEFPSDDFGGGFDNVAEVLSTGTLLVEKYAAAAELLSQEALLVSGEARIFSFEAETVGGSSGGAQDDNWALSSNGTISTTVTLDATGPYLLRARAFQRQGGPDDARMVFRIDGADVQGFDVAATAAAPQVYEHEVALSAGAHTFAVAFTNDFYDPDVTPVQDRNLHVDVLEVEGPTDAVGVTTPVRDRIVTCDPAAVGAEPCLRTIFTDFARRAFRRPATPEELDGLVGMLAVAEAHGEGFEQALQLGLEAILLSPSFLYRVELDATPDSDVKHRVSDYELASRLSYAFWSGPPDDELLNLAGGGTLAQKSVLDAQVERMLADPRARAFIDGLAGQWLQARNVDVAAPDPTAFPDYRPELNAAMQLETAKLVQHFLTHQLPMADLIDAPFTFINQELADFYDLPFVPMDATASDDGIDDDGFARVSTEGTGRPGILGHAAFLTQTSFALRTSPVKRGKWVMEQILCAPPPAPPPEVEGIPEPAEGEEGGSLRERFERHRSDPECASCHAQMDPIGFSLEHYNAVGQYRDDDNGFEIDDSGVFLGQEFRGAVELASVLKNDFGVPDCFASKVSTFALGKVIAIETEDVASDFVDPDICTINDISRRFQETDTKSIRDLVNTVVSSDAFQMRRGGAL